MGLDADEIRSTLPKDFTVDTPLGSGGQGAVYRGTYRGTPAAVKIFDPRQDPRRLKRELSLLSSIDCPYLVKLLGADTLSVGGLPATVVAYELYSGGDCSALIASREEVDAAELHKIGYEVALAIEALWGRRICHRDIKPQNIVIANGKYVLVDVGIAKHLDLSNITSPGLAPGTFGYMSPEQYLGRRQLTIHSDIFSLGITLFQIASKQHPFKGIQPQRGMMPMDLKALRASMPPLLGSLIMQMLSPLPAQRPSNISARFALLAS